MATKNLTPGKLTPGHVIIENGRHAGTVLAVTTHSQETPTCSKRGVHVKTTAGTWCYPAVGLVTVQADG